MVPALPILFLPFLSSGVPPTAAPREALANLLALDRALEGEAPEVGAASVPGTTALAASQSLRLLGGYREAAALLARVPTDDPLEPFAQLLAGEDLEDGGDPAGAEALFRALGAAGAGVAQTLARRRLGEVLLAQGRFAEAAVSLRVAAGVAGATPEPRLWEALGRALLGMGDPVAAARAFEEAWAIDPDEGAGRDAGQELARLPEGARRAACSSDRLLSGARRLLGTGHPNAALDELRAALAHPGTAPPPKALEAEAELLAGQAERALGRGEAAVPHWRRAAALGAGPIAARARIALARELEAHGEWEAATRWLRAAARAAGPAGADAAYLKAWIELHRGRVGPALAALAGIARGRGRHAAEARWAIGWVDFTRGHFEAAALGFERLAAKTSSPFAPQGLYWAARAWARLGKSARANAALATLRRLAPGSYYCVLAGGAVALPALSPTAAAGGCAAAEEEGGSIETRRAGLLWALGFSDLSLRELELAQREATTPGARRAVAEVELALGHPGRAFALVASGRASCGDRSIAELFPRPFRSAVERAAGAAGVDPLLVWAIMRQESHFRTGARSAARAAGLMQLLGTTIDRIAALTGTLPPRQGDIDGGLAVAAWYLGALSERFHGNVALVAAAYNGGPEAVAAWLAGGGDRRLERFVEEIPFKETRGYVKAVLGNYASYQRLFGGGAAWPGVDPALAPGRGPFEGVAF